MKHLIPFFTVLLVGGTASAADRTYALTSFDRIRVEGPFDVRLATGKSPGGRAVGDDHALDALVVSVEGKTVILRLRPLAVGESAAPPKVPLVITLSTLQLASANARGNGKLAITGMKGQRIDLSINGAASMAVTGIDADQLNATIVGPGTMTLAGRAARARYQLSGAGTFEAAELIANDLIARSEGSGDTHVAARFTADVTSSGLGAITVAGKPACKTQSAGGPITCSSK